MVHEDSPDKLSVVETVKTEFGAKTMGLDTKTHNLFVDTSDFDPPAPATEKQPNPQPRAKQDAGDRQARRTAQRALSMALAASLAMPLVPPMARPAGSATRPAP